MRLDRRVLFCGILAAAVSAALPGRVAAVEDELTGTQVLDAFNLRAGAVITLEADTPPGQPFTLDIPIGGETYTANVWPKSVRDPLFEVRAQLADGSYQTVDPGPVRTFVGVLEGVEGSVVAGSVLPGGLSLAVRFPEGDRYWLDAVTTRIPDAPADQFVLYTAADQVIPEHTCLLLPGDGQPAEVHEGGGSGGVAGGQNYFAQLALDADVEFFQGFNNVPATEAQIELIVNLDNNIYISQLEIEHAITAIVVRTAEPDPYSSNDAATLRNQVQNEWNNNQPQVLRDAVQLFTGKNICSGAQGCSTAGVAIQSSVCTNNDASVVEGFGSNNCVAHVSAHELGHSWGADHCSCFGFIMNASFPPCSDDFHPTQTIPEMIAYRNSIADSCLDLGDSLLRILIDGPVEVEDASTAQFTAVAQFQFGSDLDVTNQVTWSVIPDTVGSMSPGGVLTAVNVSEDTPATIHAEWTFEDDFDVDDHDITILDVNSFLAVDVILETSANLNDLCEGQSFTIDFLAAASSDSEGDISDVRLLQYDTSESVGITVDSFTWDFQELSSSGLYFLDATPPIVNASYTGLSSVPGFIVNLTQTPQVVGHMDVTFEGGAGSLNVCGPEIPPSSDFGVRFFVGFVDLLEFTLPLGNINCVAIPLTEGTGDCDDISLVSSDPPTDAIDARQPSNLDGSNVAGFDSIDLTFSGDPSSLTPGDFTATEQGGDGIAPGVASVVVSDVNTVTLTFDSIIEVGAWTTVTFDATGESVRIGYLPADANGDGTSSAVDVLALIDSLNGVTPLPIYSTDIDRSGIPGAADVLRQIDLLNGAGVYPVFNGMSLPD